jgi:hypothetical protein
MELVLVIATITSFFSHFLIERAVLANTVSMVFATLITWALAGAETSLFVQGNFLQLVLLAVTALVVSVVVGFVFAYHKKCS